MAISITVGKARLSLVTMKNDDGTPFTTPQVSAPHPSVRATYNPATGELAVVGVSANATGANVRVTGAVGTFAEQLFTVAAPTGLASTSFGAWSAEVDPPSWA